ncbi:MAG TPA: ATPase, partial [Sulfurimonas sp.]|nr:ATPase [Sulfurimonas sp.]
ITEELDEIIEKKVLTNYRYIHGDTTKITQSNKLHHSLLSAIATGDRREHSAFKKTQTGRHEGEESIDFLVDNDLLDRDKPQAQPLDSKEKVSEKLHFTLPFMRFWFANISPFYKGIKEGDYTEFSKSWENSKAEFSNYIYERLVLELIKKNFEKTDPIQKIGSYWDSDNSLDILAKTKSGKVIAGAWKFSKAKAKKSELAKVKETCEKIDMKADIYIIFSKSGFSNELKNEKGESLRLYALKNLNTLIQDLSPSDLIENTNKMY